MTTAKPLPHVLYADMAEELKRLTGLVPVPIRSKTPVWEPVDVEVAAPPGAWAVIGLRLFHGPREMVIVHAATAGEPRIRGPVDATAYALDAPPMPLDPHARPEGYRGDVMRFVAADLGMVVTHVPLVFRVQRYGYDEGTQASGHPPMFFEGYAVLQQDRAIRNDTKWPGAAVLPAYDRRR